MSFGSSINHLFRKSPLARTFLWVFIVLAAIILSAVIGRNVKRKPSIESINPTVGSPGDIMVISGENFGTSRGTSYVELGGSRVTSSGYLAWDDNQIKIVLPSNVQDGLVIVGTSAGRSEPSFFANESGIPVAVHPDVQTTIPVVDSVLPETAAVGQVITILGSNFGSVRGTSQVLFTAGRESSSNTTNNSPFSTPPESAAKKIEYLTASENDYDYEFWSDTELHVRVPDGSTDGQVYVQTAKGTSETKKITLDTSVGTKQYSDKHTYIIQVSADIANAIADSNATITLYVPRPSVTSFQPTVDLTECFPEPLIKDDKHVIVHQKQLKQFANRKQRFTQNYVVTNYAITSSVKSQRVTSYLDSERLLYSDSLKTNSLLPVSNSTIIGLKDKIIEKATNPYVQAKLIYDFMIDNYEIKNKIRTGNVSILDLPVQKKGDAYDFAILYTTLCRASGIPAVPVSGILIQEDSTSINHWWTELYFENFGWFPVDVSLGAGLDYKPFTVISDPKTYYFGNLDSQHIAFSRGWNNIKPSIVGSKTVYRPRTYALQSIWEEATTGTKSYSSLWNDPVILGIY